MRRPAQKTAIAAVFAAMYAAVGLFRHWRFDSSAYDLGIYDQVVWHLSRFEAPASTIIGMSNVLGDHFSPVWLLAAPLYWIHAGPETLILLQSVLFGASIIPVLIFLERRLPSRVAILLAVAYGLFWGLQRAAEFDVHEFAFAPLFIALMVLGIDNVGPGRRQNPWPLFLAGAIPLLFVKEDLAPLAAAGAALLALRAPDRATRWRAAGFAGVALAFFAVIVGWLIPTMSDAGTFQYGSAYSASLSGPTAFVKSIFWPAVKMRTASLWLLPFLFFPLASPFCLLIVPLMLERFLSNSPNHWGVIFHYSAPLAPILAMAAGDGLARMARRLTWQPRTLVTLASVSVLFSAILPGNLPVWKLFRTETYRPAFASVARDALAMVPPDASVVAQGGIVPHLSRRHAVYMLRASGPGAGADAEFVVAAPDDVGQWPFADSTGVREAIRSYEQRGYARKFDEGGWVVLSAPSR